MRVRGMWLAGLVGVFAMVFLLTSAVFSVLDWPTIQQIGLPSESIGAVKLGDHVQTSGTIGGQAGTVVASAQLTSCGRGNHCWDWRFSNFNLSSGSSSLIVDTSHLQGVAVFGAPHTLNGGQTEQYWAGDSVVVDGVAVSESGTLALQASALAPTASALASGLAFNLQAFYIVWIVTIALTAMWAVLSVIRGRRFRESVRNAPQFQRRLEET